MSEVEIYKTIGQPASAEFKDRGSKFLAFAYPVDRVPDCKNYLQQLKKAHPKAVHYCFAYRIGIDGNNFRVSDDGEPAGSAGKPILGQIDSKEVTNIMVIVLRYYGGTLLGVPGLINAYKTVTSLALQVTPIISKPVEVKYLINFDYTQMNEVMLVMKHCSCTIIKQELQLFCNITVSIPKSRLSEALYRLNELRHLELIKIIT